MRIAFDLDNTLLKCGYHFPNENGRTALVCQWIGLEPIRRGTRELIQYFKSKGWEVWVYTTSYRSAWYIRVLFGLHGIRLDGIVNQQRHNRRVPVKGNRCSKYPPEFGIDVLIDDSEGVWLEGQKWGYSVILVKPENEQWVAQVKSEASQIKRSSV